MSILDRFTSPLGDAGMGQEDLSTAVDEAGVALTQIGHLVEHLVARREEAQRFKALSEGVEAELAGELDQYDPELTQGVRVLWIREGRAARDETAFRHALKTGHRLRQSGQRLTDAAIIDAYERVYGVAQEVGADGRKAELPPMRDRQTMARRVRGYVTTSKSEVYGSSSVSGQVTSAERKALATMGRRGGKKAAERWKNRPQRQLRPRPPRSTPNSQ